MTARWQEIVLPMSEGLDIRLSAAGYDSFQETDSNIIVYLPEGESPEPLLALCPELTVAMRDEEDWANAWKQYYKPTPIGKRLLIQPAWLPHADAAGRAVFLNNPGMSFGTGLHASTRMCLDTLEELSPAWKCGNCETAPGNNSGGQRDDADTVPCGTRVLDIGCGSGILGLCALVLGAESAVGIDIDPNAARTALDNARLNSVEKRYTALTGDFLSDKSLRQTAGSGFDLIFSNIVADIIIALAPLIAPHMAPDALWIVSGIIEPRMQDVTNTLSAEGFLAKGVLIQDGWVSIKCGR